jgi:hypothetical protein
MDDWGEDGPWFGPIKWFHCTYLSTFGLGFVSGEEYIAPSEDASVPAPMYFCDDMIYYNGVYYGDWETQLVPGEASAECDEALPEG